MKTQVDAFVTVLGVVGGFRFPCCNSVTSEIGNGHGDPVIRYAPRISNDPF